MREPRYLFKNRFGIYYFRIRISEAVRTSSGVTRAELRYSLRTRNRSTAIFLARKAWVAMMEKNEQVRDPDPSLRSEPQVTLDLLKEVMKEMKEMRHELSRVNSLPAGTNPPAAKTPAIENDAPLADAIKRFLEQKNGETEKRTVMAYAHKCDIFRNLVEEKLGRPALLSDVNAETLRHYKDRVPKLLKHSTTHSRSVPSASQTRTSNKISSKTAASHLTTARTFLIWAEAQQYPVTRVLVKILGKMKKAQEGGRVPFEPSDLRLLFQSAEYHRSHISSQHGYFSRDSEFWLPLLGLFTGAREAELCQLYIKDAYLDTESGIWVIDINGNDGKKLKTKASKRRIPIHSQLIKLGFLDFVDRMEKYAARWPETVGLFERWEKRNKHKEFSSFSKRFNRYKRARGVNGSAGAMKDFHSFRHNVATMLQKKGCQQYVLNAITGHTQENMPHNVKTYGHGLDLPLIQEWVEKLKYDVDFSEIKLRW